MHPKTLKPCSDVTFAKAWEPSFPELATEPQTFQMLYPWFLMSGVGQVCTVGLRFKGWLQSFEPAGMDEAGMPQATLTIGVAQ